MRFLIKRNHLTFTNLALRRGSNLLFKDVSLTIHQERKVSFVGANGAGKTSLYINFVNLIYI